MSKTQNLQNKTHSNYSFPTDDDEMSIQTDQTRSFKRKNRKNPKDCFDLETIFSSAIVCDEDTDRKLALGKHFKEQHFQSTRYDTDDDCPSIVPKPGAFNNADDDSDSSFYVDNPIDKILDDPIITQRTNESLEKRAEMKIMPRILPKVSTTIKLLSWLDPKNRPNGLKNNNINEPPKQLKRCDTVNELLERKMERRVVSYSRDRLLETIKYNRDKKYFEEIYAKTNPLPILPTADKDGDAILYTAQQAIDEKCKEILHYAATHFFYGPVTKSETRFTLLFSDISRLIYKKAKTIQVIKRRERRFKLHLKRTRQWVIKHNKETGENVKVYKHLRIPRVNKSHQKVIMDFNTNNLKYPANDTLRSAIKKTISDPTYVSNYINHCIEISNPLIKDIAFNNADDLTPEFVRDNVPCTIKKIIRAFDVCSKVRKLRRDVFRKRERVVIPRYIYKFVRRYLMFDEAKEFFSDKKLVLLKHNGSDLLITEEEYIHSYCSVPLKRCLYNAWKLKEFDQTMISLKVSKWANEQKKKKELRRHFTYSANAKLKVGK